MIEKNLELLSTDIERLKREGNFEGCISVVEQLESKAEDLHVRVILAITKATCALRIENLALARSAISQISRSSLNTTERLYFDLVEATVLQQEGNAAGADAILVTILSTKESSQPEHSEVRYEALARRGFIAADSGKFEIALRFLRESHDVLAHGDIDENILLYEAFCLQALGHLDAAELLLSSGIKIDSGNLVADMFYRLGAVYLQKRSYKASMDAFKKAELAMPHGSIRLRDIFLALSEVCRESGELELAEQYATKAKLESSVQ